MKLFLSLCLSYSLLSQSAIAVPDSKLERVFDDLRYSLEVDWDQSDEAFYEAKIEEFKQEIGVLKKEGLTHEEMIDFAVSKMESEAEKIDFREIVALVNTGKLSFEQVNEMMNTFSSTHYNQGASWSAWPTSAVVVVTLLFASLVVVLIAVDNGDLPGYSKTI